MRAEVVAVGDELLLGDNVDTNSAWISARLAEIGVEVVRHTAVGDAIEAIRAVLEEAVTHADVVIVTGGLGPTQDDRTREAVALLAGAALERREELVDYLHDYFARAGRDMPERNLVQADLPVGARVIPAAGTAAGFALDVDETVVYCLPGVPSEMRTMVARDVIGDLTERGGLATTVSRVVRTAGVSEAAVADTAAELDQRLEAARAAGRPTPSIAFLASSGETRVRVTATAADRETALALVDPVITELVEQLGSAVVGVDAEGVEHAVARLLLARGWTVAVAESVTAGGVAARLARVPGASTWLRGGVVAYQTQAKTVLAGVPPSLLEPEGPVSEAVAGALADGVRERLDADVGLGVVGVAGPTSQGGVAVGTVCLGVVGPDGQPRTRALRMPDRGREEIQAFASSAALDYLRRRITSTR